MKPSKSQVQYLIFSGILFLMVLGLVVLFDADVFSGFAKKVEPKKITRASVPASPLPPATPPPIRDPIRIEEKTFGKSVQGRAIEGYEIGSGKETLILISAIHGDEKNTADLLNRFVLEIKNNPSLVADSKKLVVIPIANPDGYEERADNLNANTVNLNRNLETRGWKPYDTRGSSAGRQPFSEVESRVIQQVIRDYEATTMISFHSQGGLVSPEENEASITLAKWYAEQTGYQYFDEWDYPGTATKWFVEAIEGPAITVELSDHEQSEWEKNKEALLALVSS